MGIGEVELPDTTDPTDAARVEGGCGECDLTGRRPDGLYCDCSFARGKQADDMQAVEEKFNNAGVPPRLRGVTLDSFRRLVGDEVMRQPALQAVRDVLAGEPATDPTHGTDRPGVCLLGKNGIGKSGLLVILARHVFRSGHIPLWIKYADLVRDGVQAGYGVSHVEDGAAAGGPAGAHALP